MNAAASLVEPVRSDLADTPARWSWLWSIMASPAHAREAALRGKDPTISMKLGTAGHAVTFEQPYKVFRKENPKTGKVWNRSAKEWKEDDAQCKAEGSVLLTVKEYDKACRIRDALRGHPDAAALLFGDGVLLEQPIHWHRGADKRVCSSRPDARKPGQWTADLKVVRSANPAPYMFPLAAKRAGYLGQLAYYREADCFELGRSLDVLGPDLYLVAVEPFPPWAVTVFELDRTAREHGEKNVAACWELLTAHEAINSWPAYSHSIVPLVVEDRDDDFSAIDPPDPEDRDDQEDL